MEAHNLTVVGQAEAPKEAKKEEGGGFFGFGKKEAPVRSLALYTSRTRLF